MRVYKKKSCLGIDSFSWYLRDLSSRPHNVGGRLLPVDITKETINVRDKMVDILKLLFLIAM